MSNVKHTPPTIEGARLLQNRIALLRESNRHAAADIAESELYRYAIEAYVADVDDAEAIARIAYPEAFA
jgi:hypothetical protein